MSTAFWRREGNIRYFPVWSSYHYRLPRLWSHLITSLDSAFHWWFLITIYVATSPYRKRSHICNLSMWSHYHHRHNIIVLILRGCFYRTHGLNKLFLHLMRALCFCIVMISYLVFFSCISLIRNHVIFLVLFGINKHL